MTKTITELQQDKKLLLDAIDILDKITEEENDVKRTDTDFQYYESWATSDIKKELTSKIGEIDVQLEYNEDNTTDTTDDTTTDDTDTTDTITE